jgi:hypothetical protein
MFRSNIFFDDTQKEEHYAKYPYEKEGSYSQNEDDDFQMHSPKPSTKVTPPSIAPSMKGSNGREGGKANTESGEGKEKTAPGTEITKRPRGRPRKVVDEDNTASGTEITKRPRGRPRKVVDVENTSGGSAEVKGAPKRKIAQPSKKDAANTAPTVVDEFSTESISKSIAKRKRLPGPLQRSPFGK